ncbi:MAG: RNA polymerase factor sigma-54 [Bacteroidales bacterium]|nr:RNA polymerase factor sigma-54 [Bacteroidales bacterium]
MAPQGLTLKQQQKLTPMQVMLMHMLQMPVSMLEQAVKEEMERNPLLEEEGHDETATPDIDHYEETAENDSEEAADNHELDLDEAFSSDDDYDYREREEYDPNQEDRQLIISDDISFLDSLQSQLGLKNLSDRQRAITDELIGSIDNAGYLSRSIDLIENDLAFRHGMEVTKEEMEEALRLVQSLDPAGVGARNLQECLSIQLHRLDKPNPAEQLATTIVDQHFDNFSERHYNALQQALTVDEQTLEEAIAAIRRLNPKPGSDFADASATATGLTEPDFIVTRNGGTLSFILAENNMPRLRVSNYYLDMLKEMATNKKPSLEEKDTLKFLRTKSDSAQMFIGALQQRYHTLTVTMDAILNYQYNYFLSGDPLQLKPMRLKDISVRTELDISTISRVVNQKYVQTEFGTFLLKEIFTSAVNNKAGEAVSSDVIRQHIQEAIEAENKRAPLSDEALVKMLHDKGIDVARRTVAKYRSLLDIPTARMRKGLKR